MQAFTRSVFELFGSKRRYLVPLFQRQYVWSLERQWEPLWEDVRGKAQTYLEDQEPDAHFLGAIVLCQVPIFRNQVLAHDVIDGQQRLTTLQLLLAAFRDVSRKYGQEAFAAELKPYLQNEGLMEAPHEKWKVWPTQADQEQFTRVMETDRPESLALAYPKVMLRKKVQPRPKMVEAYCYFFAAIEGFVKTSGADPLKVFSSLHAALHQKLKIVSIELETRDDPQVIFETLNARGEPLLPSDLLRNFIFLRANRANEPSVELYERYWQEFDSQPDDESPDQAFWKVEERQGRLKRARLDLFLQHYLTMKLVREINIAKLYQSYRDWILQSAPFASIEAELQDIKRFASEFERLIKPSGNTRLDQLARRLRSIDTSTVYPVLLFVMAEPSLTVEDKAAIAQDLESYLVRRMVCGLTNKNYNQLFPQLIRDMLLKGGITPERIRDWLTELAGDSSRWPDDHEFASAWLEGEAYARLDSAKLTMILGAIEQALHHAKREDVHIGGNLTVEHIMPQAWRAKWPKSDGHLAAESEDTPETQARDRVLHTFGNLTLLTQALNSSLGNAPFRERQIEIVQQSALQLNAYFQGRQTWDIPDITARGRVLLSVATKLWPYPGRGSTEWTEKTIEPVTAPIGDQAERFRKIEAQSQGFSTIPSLGYDHFLKLVGGISPVALEDALIDGCLESGFLVKVVKQELSIYSDRPGFKAFYATARRRQGALECYFNPTDVRLGALKIRFSWANIPEYVGFKCASPTAVREFLGGVAAIEKERLSSPA